FTPMAVQTGVDGKGNAIVAWVEKEGADTSVTPSHVWIRSYLAGQGWQSAVELGRPNATSFKVNLSADMDALGNTLVSWDAYIDTAESQRRIFAYDALRNASGADWVRTTRYVYDAAGRLTDETSGFGSAVAATTHYGLDALGNRRTIVDPRGVE